MQSDSSPPRPRPSTLLALVQRLTTELASEREVVEKALELVNGGSVVLTGSFRNCRLASAPCPETTHFGVAGRRAPGRERLPGPISEDG